MTLTAKISITVGSEDRILVDTDAEFPIEGFDEAKAGWTAGKIIRAAQRLFGNDVPEPPEEY